MYTYKTLTISTEADVGNVLTTEAETGWEFVCFTPWAIDGAPEAVFRQKARKPYRSSLERKGL